MELLRKLKNMNLFQALEAFRLTFGDDALQALSTSRNTFDAIVNTFINADHQKKDEFIGRLDGTYQDEPIDLDIVPYWNDYGRYIYAAGSIFREDHFDESGLGDTGNMQFLCLKGDTSRWSGHFFIEYDSFRICDGIYIDDENGEPVFVEK